MKTIAAGSRLQIKETLSTHIKLRQMLISLRRDKSNVLSKRENEILLHLSNGKKKSQISKDLFIDLETVRSHVRAIYKKFGVHTKTDAIKIAVERNYIIV